MAIKIGADPEFEILDANHHLVSAYSYFTGDNALYDKLGVDGCSSTGELRPDPGTPTFVMQEINRLVAKAGRELQPQHDIHAGGGQMLPLGGHIHFSGISVSGTFVYTLDRLITRPLKELSSSDRRSTDGYDSEGSTRSNNHGWEYRSPCSWLAHPVIARGVLEIAYQLALLWDVHITKETNREKQVDWLDKFDDLKTVDNLIDIITDVKVVKVLTEYQEILYKMRTEGVYLEEVEVLMAWKKRKVMKKIPYYLPLPLFSPELSKPMTDMGYNPNKYMKEVFEELAVVLLKHRAILGKGKVKSVRFVGASAERTGYNKVYCPPKYYRMFSSMPDYVLLEVPNLRVSGGTDFVYIGEWRKPDFGLSTSLRENPVLCSKAIYKVLQTVSSKSWVDRTKHANTLKKIEEKNDNT